MMHKLRLIRFQVIMIILLTLLIIPGFIGCKRSRTPEESQTVKLIAPYCLKLEEYKTDHLTYPLEWNDLLVWMQKDMPLNPYTNEPMIALGSKIFDPDISPGNIYYQRVVQYDEVIKCQVYIFGKRGVITCYQHSNPIAPY